jgi:hypothetical protein
MIELNEFVFKKMNFPRRFWFTTPSSMDQVVRKSHEEFIRDWLSKFSERGSNKEDLLIFGKHSNDLFSVIMQAIARRGIECVCFHPNEIELLLDRNPTLKSEWYDVPVLGIHAFFEEQSYDWKTRNLLYSILKHRWLNKKVTVLATKTEEKDRLADLMEGSIVLEDFIRGVEMISTSY